MIWNLPNILTVARLSVLPVIVALIWPGIESRYACFWAAIIYGLASAFDVVDGYIARTTNQVTVLGKFLDPLADKLFYLVTMIALLQLEGPRMPPILLMVILIRELSITGLRAIAASEGIVIDAGEGGKVKTTFATVGMIGLLIHYPYIIDFLLYRTTIDFHRAGLWITILSTLFSITSAVDYWRGFSHAMRGRAPKRA